MTKLEKIHNCNEIKDILDIYEGVLFSMCMGKCEVPNSVLIDDAKDILKNVVELKIKSLIYFLTIDKL